MPLDWTEWRSKLIAIDYPNAASLNEQTVLTLLFRPSAKREKLIIWISRKIVESTGYNGPDLLSIFSSFVFGAKETLDGFIEGTHSKNVMENIWNSILNDLRPLPPICGDRESRRAVLLSGTTTMSAELLELHGITGPPPDDSSPQPDILDGVDDIVSRAEAVLAKHSAVVTPPSVITPCVPEKPVKPLSQLIEDACCLIQKVKSNNSLEGLVERNELEIAKIRDAAVDLDEFVDQLGTMKVAMKKLESHGIVMPSVNPQDD